jgi:hypothetical protein
VNTCPPFQSIILPSFLGARQPCWIQRTPSRNPSSLPCIEIRPVRCFGGCASIRRAHSRRAHGCPARSPGLGVGGDRLSNKFPSPAAATVFLNVLVDNLRWLSRYRRRVLEQRMRHCFLACTGRQFEMAQSLQEKGTRTTHAPLFS